jgi:hypothetical protein
MTKILDCIALAYIRRRLARYRRPGDAADLLGDALVSLMGAEIQRRNRVLGDWEAEVRAAKAAEAAARQAREAVERFQSVESDSRLRM